MKITWKYFLFCRSKEQFRASKGKTWSRGKNSRYPFAVNLNLSVVSNGLQCHVLRWKSPVVANRLVWHQLKWRHFPPLFSGCFILDQRQAWGRESGFVLTDQGEAGKFASLFSFYFPAGQNVSYFTSREPFDSKSKSHWEYWAIEA